MPFYIEDLTVNDSALDVGEEKQFDKSMGMNNAKIRSVKIVALTGGAMNVMLEIWEKDSDGYNPLTRSSYYMRIFRRTIIQTEEQGAEYHEILDPEILYFDRDNSGEMHFRLTNNAGGTSSDFAVVIKCAEIGEAI